MRPKTTPMQWALTILSGLQADRQKRPEPTTPQRTNPAHFALDLYRVSYSGDMRKVPGTQTP